MFLLRSALRSVVRRPLKSCMTLFGSICLALLINMFAGTIDQHQQALGEIHASIEVTGRITMEDGRSYGLSLEDEMLTALEGSGFIGKKFYTRVVRSMLQPWQGDEQTLQVLVGTSFRMVGANDVGAIPEFFRQEEYIQYLDGYDSTLFASADGVCVVSKEFLDAYGLGLGDSLHFTVVEDITTTGKPVEDVIPGTASVKVVGVFPDGNVLSPIYCPLELVASIYEELGIPDTTDSASYILQNTERLDQFEELLQGLGFVSPRSNAVSSSRLAFVINDRLLRDAVSDLQRQIDIINAMFPVLALLCAGLGIALSHLMVRLRKRELAFMRSLGTNKLVMLLSLFSEQLLLCLLGGGLGLVIITVISDTISGSDIYRVIGFLTIYLASTFFSILAFYRGDVIKILTAKE